MSFEDEKLAQALKLLQDTEKKCESSANFTKSAEAKRLKKEKGRSEVLFPTVLILNMTNITRLK